MIENVFRDESDLSNNIWIIASTEEIAERERIQCLRDAGQVRADELQARWDELESAEPFASLKADAMVLLRRGNLTRAEESLIERYESRSDLRSKLGYDPNAYAMAPWAETHVLPWAVTTEVEARIAIGKSRLELAGPPPEPPPPPSDEDRLSAMLDAKLKALGLTA